MKHAARWRTLSGARRAKRYPTDLTDDEWERIKPLLPKAPGRGRKPSVDLRTILDAIRYMARSGGGWRMLPNDSPPWQTVYWWFRRLMRRFLFRTIHDMALMLDRERAGREDSPTAAVVHCKRWPWLKHLFADGAYNRTQLMSKARFFDFIIDVVRRSEKSPGPYGDVRPGLDIESVIDTTLLLPLTEVGERVRSI